MGIYVGDASLIQEHGRGEWHVDYDTWVGMLQKMYRSQPFLERELTMPALATFFGIPIRMDDTLPPGTIELRNVQGETLGRMENVGSRPSTLPRMELQHEPRRTEKMPTKEQLDRFSEYNRKFLDETQPAIGPTTRLAKSCRACGDELPLDAVYCISCRTKV